MKFNKYWILIGLILTLLLIPASIYFNILNSDTLPFQLNKYQLTLIIIITAGLILLLYKYMKFKTIYVLIILFGGMNVLSAPIYSPIDEGSHLDYIWHIQDNWEIPLISQEIDTERLASISGSSTPNAPKYGAVHPPIFYVIAATVSFPLKWTPVLQLFLLRFLGVLFLLLSVFLVNKTYQLLTSKNVIPNNPILFFSIISLLALSPGVLTRVSTISNESLVILFATLISYYFIKLIVEDNIDRKNIVIIGILSGLIILTKFNSVYIIGIIILYLLYKKAIKNGCIYIVTVGILTSPWFLFNLIHYKGFTGMAEHVQFVKPIVNPNNINLDLPFVFSEFFNLLISFWQPQEALHSLNQFEMAIVYSLISIIIISIITALIFLKHRENTTLNLFLLSMILLNFGIMVYGTISQDVNVMLGRYFYMNILPLTLIIYTSFAYLLNRKAFKLIAVALIVCTSVLFVYNIDNHIATTPYKFKLLTIVNEELALESAYLLDPSNLNTIPNYLAAKMDTEEMKISDSIELTTMPTELLLNNSVFTNSVFTVQGEDPHMIFNFTSPIVASTNYLLLDVNFPENYPQVTSQIFFSTASNGFTEDLSYRFALSNGLNIVPMNAHPNWQGDITSIRLDFDQLNISDTININAIELNSLQSN